MDASENSTSSHVAKEDTTASHVAKEDTMSTNCGKDDAASIDGGKSDPSAAPDGGADVMGNQCRDDGGKTEDKKGEVDKGDEEIPSSVSEAGA